MFGLRKSHAVPKMVEEYLNTTDECLLVFRDGVLCWIEDGLSSEFSDFVGKVDSLESNCDEIRRRVEAAMYEKSLIPESRGDVLHLIEKLDKIPNRAERVMYDILDENLTIGEAFKQPFREMITLNYGSFTSLSRAVRMLFEDLTRIRPLVEEVDRRESQSDVLRRSVIQNVFRTSNISGDQRILLRDILENISRISDHCENVADWLTIVSVKRLV